MKDYIIKTFTINHSASAITRYSRDYMSRRENVLEHIGWVANWSFIVAKQLEARNPEIRIDYGKLLTSAVIHDWDEVGSGDVPRITKYASKEITQSFKRLEDSCMTWITEYLEYPEHCNIKDIWKNAKNTYSVEGWVVKVADLAAVVYKIWEEILRLNNNSFLRVANEVSQFLDELLNKKIKSGCDKSDEYLTEIVLSFKEIVYDSLKDKDLEGLGVINPEF